MKLKFKITARQLIETIKMIIYIYIFSGFNARTENKQFFF